MACIHAHIITDIAGCRCDSSHTSLDRIHFQLICETGICLKAGKLIKNPAKLTRQRGMKVPHRSHRHNPVCAAVLLKSRS